MTFSHHAPATIAFQHSIKCRLSGALKPRLSGRKSFVIKPLHPARIGCAQSFSAVNHEKNGSCISSLLRYRNPRAVFGAIVLIGILTLNRVPLWLLPHVREERLETTPSITHIDPAAAVVSECLVFRVSTSVPHGGPGAIGSTADATGADEISLKWTTGFNASATLLDAFSQFIELEPAGVSAVAGCHNPSASNSGCSPGYFESTQCLTNKVSATFMHKDQRNVRKAGGQA